ncbi:MAG: amidohydrolase family protein [Dehalococcoidia bacterium]|nr:amidohydrolase family protein [Dehalococcoidia bacterium]
MTEEPHTVDSHHHFWDVFRLDYPWMPPGPSVVRRNYLPNDLEPLLDEVGIQKTVLVQAQQSLEEANFLLDIAESTDFVAGVVAWVDIQSPSVGHDLDTLMRRNKLVGIRHQVEDDPDDDWLVRDNTIRGLREISARDLAYDMLVKPRHMKHVPTVAAKVPDLRLVIDHIAKPLIKDQVISPWNTLMNDIADIPGIHCKVSGMVTEDDHSNWKVADLIPYVSHVREVFGMERLMFGSDWPVCLFAASYQEVLNAAIEAIGPMTAEERAGFMGGNATKFYKL